MADRHIDWEIGPLPAVQADPVLLRQVWVNLLSNAIKFTAPRLEARIEIGTLPPDGESGHVTVFVRDNGVGFDSQYAHKLFGVFQRLHLEDEFEGTGIGLATVRRIVQRHGGRVWAEGKLDQGATFYMAFKRIGGEW
jgi:chemotaxis family two-component system sensor kinase Cph1